MPFCVAFFCAHLMPKKVTLDAMFDRSVDSVTPSEQPDEIVPLNNWQYFSKIVQKDTLRNANFGSHGLQCSRTLNMFEPKSMSLNI